MKHWYVCLLLIGLIAAHIAAEADDDDGVLVEDEQIVSVHYSRQPSKLYMLSSLP